MAQLVNLLKRFEGFVRGGILKIACFLAIWTASLWANPNAVASPQIAPPETPVAVAPACDTAFQALDRFSETHFVKTLESDFPGAKIERLNAEGNVYRVELPDGSRHIAKAARLGGAQRDVRLEAEFKRMQSLPHDQFAQPIAYQPGGPFRPAYFTMKIYNGGALDGLLERLGPKVAPLEMIDLFEMVSVPLGTLHERKYGNGDVKAPNYLVELKGGKIRKIVMSDVDTVSSLTFNASFSPDYVDHDFSPNENGFLSSVKRRDLNALRILLQNMALGTEKENLPAQYLSRAKYVHGEKGPTYPLSSLNASPHAINPDVHPVISALAFGRFESVEQFQSVLEPAREAIRTGDIDKFFRETYIPMQEKNQGTAGYAVFASKSKELADSAARTSAPWAKRVAQTFVQGFKNYFSPPVKPEYHDILAR
ncbi:hypothetical protein K2X33_10270 [bacterium]|nr:hypothetical protein [bacterium]